MASTTHKLTSNVHLSSEDPVAMRPQVLSGRPAQVVFCGDLLDAGRVAELLASNVLADEPPVVRG